MKLIIKHFASVLLFAVSVLLLQAAVTTIHLISAWMEIHGLRPLPWTNMKA